MVTDVYYGVLCYVPTLHPSKVCACQQNHGNGRMRWHAMLYSHVTPFESMHILTTAWWRTNAMVCYVMFPRYTLPKHATSHLGSTPNGSKGQRANGPKGHAISRHGGRRQERKLLNKTAPSKCSECDVPLNLNVFDRSWMA